MNFGLKIEEPALISIYRRFLMCGLVILFNIELFAQCPSTTGETRTVCATGNYTLTASSVCPSGTTCSTIRAHRWYTSETGTEMVTPTTQGYLATGPTGPAVYQSTMNVGGLLPIGLLLNVVVVRHQGLRFH